MMIFNRKIEILFDNKIQFILDGQSKICNWLYNKLLEKVIEEPYSLQGRNLRNLVPIFKKQNLFLQSVYSSPLKNVAFRLKDSFKGYYKNNRGFPKFRSNKTSWFSLFYDEPNKGYKVKGNKILISLGKNELGKQLRVSGKLTESLILKETDIIKNFRLCKSNQKYYGIFCIERIDIKKKAVNNWIALDPNHKNFFVGIDNSGKSIEFEKITQTKFFDKVIDEIKSKRDKCIKYSKRYKRINKALINVYHKRREQTKLMCYTVANYIAKHYDHVAIGDYVPIVTKEKQMHRSMINQEIIGRFRNI